MGELGQGVAGGGRILRSPRERMVFKIHMGSGVFSFLVWKGNSGCLGLTGPEEKQDAAKGKGPGPFILAEGGTAHFHLVFADNGHLSFVLVQQRQWCAVVWRGFVRSGQAKRDLPRGVDKPRGLMGSRQSGGSRTGGDSWIPW